MPDAHAFATQEILVIRTVKAPNPSTSFFTAWLCTMSMITAIPIVRLVDQLFQLVRRTEREEAAKKLLT